MGRPRDALYAVCERPRYDVRWVHDLVLHQLVEHDDDHVSTAAPEFGHSGENVHTSLETRRAQCRDAPRRQIAEKREVSLDSVQEMGEGSRADVQEGLHCDRPDDGVYVDVAVVLFQRVLQRFEMGHDIFCLRPSAEKTQNELCGVVVRSSWKNSGHLDVARSTH